eukprot:COSAG04_NODE_3298_length_2960_cov_4.919609_2_plen_83_part_00
MMTLDQVTSLSRCRATAGLSLGEYTALTFAGAFSFEDGLRLVKQTASDFRVQRHRPSRVRADRELRRANAGPARWSGPVQRV